MSNPTKSAGTPDPVRDDLGSERILQGALQRLRLKLDVVGDVRFGRDVRVTGTVRVENPGSAPMAIADGTTLAG